MIINYNSYFQPVSQILIFLCYEDKNRRESGLDVKACHGFIFWYVKHVQLFDRDIYLRITHINMIGDRLFSGAGIQSSRYFNLSLSPNSGSDSCWNPVVFIIWEGEEGKKKKRKRVVEKLNGLRSFKWSLRTVFLYPYLSWLTFIKDSF